MNRSFCTAVALCVVSAFAAAAVAQDSVIFMDVRNNSITANTASNYNNMSHGTMNGPFSVTPTGDAGRRGGGQSLIINPLQTGGRHTTFPTSFPNLDGDGNRATGDLWVYMDVLNDGSGTNGVISSVGLDIDIVPPVGTVRNKIGSLSFSMINDQTVLDSTLAPGGSGPWNGVANGSQVGTIPNLDWNDARAVAVPVTTGPVYSSTGRLVPRTPDNTPAGRPYRIGRLTVTADTRVCTGATIPPFDGPAFSARSTYNVFMQVDSLLITRVFETGGDTVENVSFGYAGAVPDAPQSGNVPNVSSAVADATIQVRLKGDVDGNGVLSTLDTTPYLALVGPLDNPTSAYLGDFSAPPGVVALTNNLVTTLDTTPYLANISSNSPCP
ncbi:MAG: hypothetical protein HBSAPP02_20960 [Phycisphaerae bacterium]|nr:MAG: hypothetical protein HBSAPP02_20960 [Phycisphaerae bacterium]